MRWWVELVGAWQEAFGLGLTVVLLLLSALITATLWFFWPSWFNALAAIKFRRGAKGVKREKTKKKAKRNKEVSEEDITRVMDSDEELPDVSAEVFITLADRLAAEGRYAEAVRERLRAIVRELVDRHVVTHSPGWTVTELARAASSAAPKVEPPVTAATIIFSDIWYAERPANSTDDSHMRQLSDQVHAVLGADR